MPSKLIYLERPIERLHYYGNDFITLTPELPFARPRAVLAFLLTLILWPALFSHAATLKRFPTTSSTEIAFVAHDQLWAAPLAGGAAHHLNSNSDGVTTPLFSPNGKWIAYTARHGERRDVYIVPSRGGRARRLTFAASTSADGALVVAWTPDSMRVIYLSHQGSPVAKLVRAFSVAITGGIAVPMPLDRAGLMSFSPDGSSIAYNPIFRNLEVRKRYLGGQAQDIYTYQFATKKLTRITDWKGTDTAPMWYGRRIYFLSDRGEGFRVNLWRYDLDAKTFSQLTHFKDFDVDWPSLGGFTISFQQGGRLYAVELPTEHLREIEVEIPDDGTQTAPRVANISQAIRVRDAMGKVDYAISPQGDSVLISAHGEICVIAPSRPGQNLTQTPGVDEDHPSWSPDGKTIAYETDLNGEQQLALRSVPGGSERILTQFKTGYRYAALWSPLGDSLVVSDADHKLWWIHPDGRAAEQLAYDPYAEIRDPSFSSDGRWIAYSAKRANGTRAIHLHDLESGQDTLVSSPMESDRMPVFAPDGRTLIFVSQRNEQPFVSDRGDESLISTVNSDGIYAVTLVASDPSPLTPSRIPQVAVPTRVHIDLVNFMSRAVALPVTPAVVTSLEVRGSNMFYQTNPVQLIDDDLAGGQSALHVLDLVTLKDKVLIEGLDSATLSADGGVAAFRRRGAWHMANTLDGTELAQFDVGDLHATVDPRLEWAEMFEEAWRLDRDVFFSTAMNGTNWQTVHDAYAKLLPTLGSQQDFMYLLGQMQGEIASSHTFIRPARDPNVGGDAATALLGADYALDPATGRYKFAQIYRGDATRSDMRGPLGEPYLGVEVGDTLLAINGSPLLPPATPDSLLAGVTGAVALTIGSAHSGRKHDISVSPITDDLPLRKHDWIANNRAAVDRLSDGKLGYVYLSDFHAEGSKEFVRQFYPQHDKDGLIIDVRWNRGGFTSQAVLEVLRREQVGIFVNRARAVAPLPVATAPRAMVTLINYASASDGDQFPYFFRRLGLGRLVGERTWGGVQGINGPWTLMDGSYVTIPKDSLASLDGQWVIENEGVEPDIAAVPSPDESVTGNDSQLITAVRAALEQLKRVPPIRPQAPPLMPAFPANGEVPGASFF